MSLAELNQLQDQVSRLLTWKQFIRAKEKQGQDMSFQAFFEAARTVTSNKKILRLIEKALQTIKEKDKPTLIILETEPFQRVAQKNRENEARIRRERQAHNQKVLKQFRII